MTEELISIEATMRQNRGLEHARLCPGCDGWGVKLYHTDATYNWQTALMAGQAFTRDVCDDCWGSGDAGRPWPSHRISS